MPLGQLITCPMSNFTRAKVTLQEHMYSKQSSHKMASMDAIVIVWKKEIFLCTNLCKSRPLP